VGFLGNILYWGQIYQAIPLVPKVVLYLFQSIFTQSKITSIFSSNNLAIFPNSNNMSLVKLVYLTNSSVLKYTCLFLPSMKIGISDSYILNIISLSDQISILKTEPSQSPKILRIYLINLLCHYTILFIILQVFFNHKYTIYNS
jgi:hypothetical protein